MASPVNAERLVLGASLLALGVVWTAANMGLVDALPVLRRYWPVALVFWGVLELYNASVAKASRAAAEPPGGSTPADGGEVTL